MVQLAPAFSSERATFLPAMFTFVRLLLMSIVLVTPFTANSMLRPPSLV